MTVDSCELGMEPGCQGFSKTKPKFVIAETALPMQANLIQICLLAMPNIEHIK